VGFGILHDARAGKPDDDVAELLVELFDAIMLTWRWRPGVAI